MNESNWEFLLTDVLENNSDYKRSVGSAWGRIETTPKQPVGLASAWFWAAVAACLSGLVVAVLWEKKEPLPLHLAVEIVGTQDLARTYIEIDDQELLQLFPHGIIVAYGVTPQVYTFSAPAD